MIKLTLFSIFLCLVAFTLSARTNLKTKKSCWTWNINEHDNKKGPNRCDNECECYGNRKCSGAGWCN